MTLLTVVKDVCATVGVAVPQSVFSNINSNRTMQEMLSLANEMAQRIAYDTRDWTMLRKSNLIVGDGVETGFPLPANFKRMLLTTSVRRVDNPVQPLEFVPDLDDWQLRYLTNTGLNSNGEWIINGGSIYIRPTLPVGAQVHYTYLDKNCIKLNSGGHGDAFLADLDTFALDERVLKLAVIWQWKAQKGSPYAEDMGTYGDALTYAMGADKPMPIIIGRLSVSAINNTYPWATP